MKKLRNNRGMTLTELLMAILIVSISTSLVGVGIRLAVNSYKACMEVSQAQMLCSTLTADISDKLRFSGSVRETSGNIDEIFIQELGKVANFAVNRDGILTLDGRPIINSGAYPRGLKLSDFSIKFDSDTNIFTVKFNVINDQSNTVISQEFQVKKINPEESTNG